MNPQRKNPDRESSPVESRRVSDEPPRVLSDAEQVERFMTLYSTYQRRLYLYTLTLLPNSTDADDVFQDSNVVLWQKFDQYRPNTNFFAWGCSVIRYEVLKYREKTARAAALLDPDVLDSLAEVAVVQVEYLDEPHRVALADCSAELSESDRELMRHRYAEGMAVNAIAALLGRTANAVSQSLGRVRRWLFICINRKVHEAERGDTPAAPADAAMNAVADADAAATGAMLQDPQPDVAQEGRSVPLRPADEQGGDA
jgi:RNA polymerase sigma-70 factor (ECF subfamily)